MGDLDGVENPEPTGVRNTDELEKWGLYVSNSEPRLKYSVEYEKEIGFSRALAVGVYIFFILGIRYHWVILL